MCRVCRNPRTGGKTEQCDYEHQPRNKYYSTPTYYNYPSSTTESDNNKRASQRHHQIPSAAHQHYPSSTTRYKIISRPKSRSPYATPKYVYYTTPGKTAPKLDYEYLTQKYQPTKSTTTRPKFEYEFSTPQYHQPTTKSNNNNDHREEAAASEPESEEESEEYEEAESISDSKGCRKVQKDDMLCTICKNPKTGDASENCAYSYVPKEKLYTYSKSKSSKPKSESYEDVDSGEDESDSYKNSNEDSEDEGSDEYSTESNNNRRSDEEQSPGVESRNSFFNVKSTTEITPETKNKKSKKSENIDRIMQDFQTKDRSACKKIMKNQMTCYQCLDEDGFNKEECTFEMNSKSKSPYYEEFKDKVAEATTIRENRRRRKPTTTEPSVSESKKIQKKSTDEGSYSNNEQENDEDPLDYSSSATKSVFDNYYGFTLPRFMVDISDQEKEFDRFVASNSS